MRTRDHTQIMSELAVSAYDKTFKSVYKDFQNKIYFNIKHKQPAEQTWADYLALGCIPKPSYFLSAEYYMRSELTMEHVQDLSAIILSQLYPIIKESSPDKMEFLLRAILGELSTRILQMNVISFADIQEINFAEILLKSPVVMTSKYNLQDELRHQLFTLPMDRYTEQAEYQHSVAKLMKAKAGIWKVKEKTVEDYEREIENDFIITTTKLA